MPKPYDATSKMLIEAGPQAWLEWVGLHPRGPVAVDNVDLSTVTSAADYAVFVDSASPWAAYVEFVSAPEKGFLADIALRNALLHKRCGKPVRSIVILLHPRAFRPDLTGVYEVVDDEDGESLLKVTYRLKKAWLSPVAEYLDGPLPLMPLAVLSSEVKARDDVAPVLDRLHDRLIERLPQDRGLVKNLWTAAEVLLGLKFQGEESKIWIKSLTRGVLIAKHSIIHQDILQKGRVNALIGVLLYLGTQRWGRPNEG